MSSPSDSVHSVLKGIKSRETNQYSYVRTTNTKEKCLFTGGLRFVSLFLLPPRIRPKNTRFVSISKTYSLLRGTSARLLFYYTDKYTNTHILLSILRSCVVRKLKPSAACSIACTLFCTTICNRDWVNTRSSMVFSVCPNVTLLVLLFSVLRRTIEQYLRTYTSAIFQPGISPPF